MYQNRNVNYLPLGTVKGLSIDQDQVRIKNFENFFNEEVWDLNQLRTISWGGIPKSYRAKSWKIQFEYLPMFSHLEENTLKSKRKEYENFRKKLWGGEGYNDLLDDNYFKMKDQIVKDIKRTQADSALFKHVKVQQMMIRLLLVWHVR